MHRLLTLSVLLLAACTSPAQTTGGAGAQPPSAPPPPPAMAAQSAGIVGDYSATIAAGDFPASAPQDMRTALAGMWVIAFHDGNHFVVTQNGQQVLEGRYQVSGNQLMFGAEGETGPYACNTPATYNWARSGHQLTFTAAGADECSGRPVVLTSRPFTRAP
jgi:hypothetical protein